MPILQKEPDVFPPDLFDAVPTHPQQEWWALYTRSRREKDLLRRLRQTGTAHYCPIIEKQHRSPNGRLRKTYVPMFANYVFLRGNDHERYAAVCTGCVSRDIRVDDGESLFADLRQIHELIQTGIELTLEPEVPVGARVRVKSGVLEGREGIVIERRGRQRLLVAVDFLQQGASAELDNCDVEKL